MHRQARLLALFAVAVSALVVAQAVPSATPTDSAELRDAVTVGAILEHEEAFQAIADANHKHPGGGHNRGRPSSGRAAGWEPREL